MWAVFGEEGAREGETRQYPEYRAPLCFKYIQHPEYRAPVSFQNKQVVSEVSHNENPPVQAVSDVSDIVRTRTTATSYTDTPTYSTGGCCRVGKTNRRHLPIACSLASMSASSVPVSEGAISTAEAPKQQPGSARARFVVNRPVSFFGCYPEFLPSIESRISRRYRLSSASRKTRKANTVGRTVDVMSRASSHGIATNTKRSRCELYMSHVGCVITID